MGFLENNKKRSAYFSEDSFFNYCQPRLVGSRCGLHKHGGPTVFRESFAFSWNPVKFAVFAA